MTTRTKRPNHVARRLAHASKRSTPRLRRSKRGQPQTTRPLGHWSAAAIDAADARDDR
jgi:hypothetical protein